MIITTSERGHIHLYPSLGKKNSEIYYWLWCQLHNFVDVLYQVEEVVFHLQSFPASGSFQMSQFFTSGGQSLGASASASVLPMNIQGWFPLGLTGLISLLSKGLSRVFSRTTVQRHQFFGTQPFILSSSVIREWLLKKLYLWLDRPLLVSNVSAFQHSV